MISCPPTGWPGPVQMGIAKVEGTKKELEVQSACLALDSIPGTKFFFIYSYINTCMCERMYMCEGAMAVIRLLEV